jgi:hypothetical protein
VTEIEDITTWRDQKFVVEIKDVIEGFGLHFSCCASEQKPMSIVDPQSASYQSGSLMFETLLGASCRFPRRFDPGFPLRTDPA